MELFELNFTVRYSETDAMGIVHHASFLRWFEMGRVELMRALGHSYRDVERSGTAFPVIEARLRYLKPAHFDEAIRLTTFCYEVTKTRLCFGYLLRRDELTLAHGYTVHAALGPDGRPQRIADDFRHAIAACHLDEATLSRLKWARP